MGIFEIDVFHERNLLAEITKDIKEPPLIVPEEMIVVVVFSVFNLMIIVSQN
jgi:hypothetical protein